MASVPTQRTLKKLRAEGYLCAIVEHWNQFAHVRQDLFGIIDIVAIHPQHKGVFGIQCTDDSSVSKHLKKAKENTYLPVWLKAGNRFEVWGWGLKGKVGERKTWQVRVKTI